jgi:protein disulfide isomerase
MKLLIIPLLFVFVFNTGFETFHDPRDDFIVKFTDDNYDEEIKKHDILLIEFYAPWDSNSIKLAEEMRRAADILSKSKYSIKIAQVDCHSQTGLKERFEIKEYPRFKLYKDGELTDITLDATFAENIIEFYRKILGPLVREVRNEMEINDLLVKNEKVIVYYGDNKIDLFTNLASDKRLIFAHCNNECNKNESERIILKRLEEEFILTEPISEESIIEFIDNNIYHYFTFSSPFTVDYVFTNNKIVLFYIIDTKTDEFVDIIKEVSKDYKNKMYFIIANNETKELTRDITDYYLITTKDLPQIRLTNVVGDEEVLHYAFEGEFNSANLKNFIDNFFEGKLESYVRSEPVPEHQGIVYKIVGKSFEEVVLKSKKNVFLKIYAPEDTASKGVMADYIKLATAFKDVDNLLIAEINIIANEIDIPIEGYPTFKLFLANDKENPIEYEDRRHFEFMKNFLNEKLGLNIQGEEVKQEDSEKLKVDL